MRYGWGRTYTKYLIQIAIALVFFGVIFIFTPKAKAASSDIHISEIFYDPAGDDTGYEWIELYNSGDLPADLEGYNLYYYSGTYYKFPTFSLAGKSYALVHINCNGSDGLTDLYTETLDSNNMGNTNGSVALFNSSVHSSATIVDFVEYGAGGKTWESAAVTAGVWTAGDFVVDAAAGHSIGLKDIGVDNNQSLDWLDQSAPNPKGEEIVVKEDEEEDLSDIIQVENISILEARSKENGENVSVTGIVSVPPGRLSLQYFYIQDGDSGIQIYNYSKSFPALNAGDEVKITGEMATISGERRIKTSGPSDITMLSSHPPPEAALITIDQIDESYEGEYVRVVGTVTKTSGSTFYIHGSGEIQVSIRAGTGIKKPKMKVGDVVEVAGILSQYKDSYRLLPIVQSDVKIIKSSALPKAGPELIYIIIISTILSWTTLAILRRRQRL